VLVLCRYAALGHLGRPWVVEQTAKNTHSSQRPLEPGSFSFLFIRGLGIEGVVSVGCQSVSQKQ
jgi:hypothetical protein